MPNYSAILEYLSIILTQEECNIYKIRMLFMYFTPLCQPRQKNPLFTREKSGLRNEKNHHLSQSMDKVQNYTATFLNTECDTIYTRGCQISMQGPQLCAKPRHFANQTWQLPEWPFQTLTYMFYKLPLQIQRIEGTLQYKIAPLTPQQCILYTAWKHNTVKGFVMQT